MTDRQRLALLDKAVAELEQTEKGYTENPNGTHWRPAMANLDRLRRDLAVPPLTFCHPIPKGVTPLVVGGLHRTAGDVSFSQNWARDFLVKAGTPILAVEPGKVVKLSGHDPDDDSADAQGVYGWSIHWETDAGYHWFLTHLGVRAPLEVGDRVELGEILGRVGDQRFRDDHAHLGATAPSGAKLEACRRIDAIASGVRIAPRVAA